MPHAIQIRQTGGPGDLNWTLIEVGEPGSGQVRLRQAAPGLNYTDVYHRRGYYSRPLPIIHASVGCAPRDLAPLPMEPYVQEPAATQESM